MRRRLFTVASVLSLLLWVATVVLWIVSDCRERDGPPLIAFGNVRVGASEGTVVVYNQQRPFFDGTIGVAGAPWPKEFSVRVSGLGLRRFTWPGEWPGGTCWTFWISLVYPIALTLVVPSSWGLAAVLRRRRSIAQCCPTCGYNLNGNTSGTCPECGKDIPRGLEGSA